LKKENGYSLYDLFNQIKQLKPDLVCGEIYARDYDTNMKGYYPPENAVVEHAAKTIGASYYPADWRGNYHDMEAAINAMTEDEHKMCKDSLADLKPLLRKQPDVFNMIHMPEAQALIKKQHESCIKAGSEVSNGYWYARNQLIVKNCMRKAQSSKAKRILFTFGGHHKYIIEEYLEEYYGVKAKKVKKLYRHQNKAMPGEVVDEWIKNRKGLLAILADPNAPAIYKDMIKNSKRALMHGTRCIRRWQRKKSKRVIPKD